MMELNLLLLWAEVLSWCDRFESIDSRKIF